MSTNVTFLLLTNFENALLFVFWHSFPLYVLSKTAYLTPYTYYPLCTRSPVWIGIVSYRPKTCNVRSMFQDLYTHNLRLLLNRETTKQSKVFTYGKGQWCPQCSLLEGMVSRDEYFFEGPKTHNSTFWMRADGFRIFFCCIYVKKIQMKFLFPSMYPQRFPQLFHVTCLKGLGLENRFQKFDKNVQLWATTKI